MFMWIILNFIVLITFLYLYDFFKNRRKYELAAKFNGPMKIPFFGNALIYLSVSPEDIIKYCDNFSKKYGKIYRIWVFSRLTFFITDIKIIENILSSTKLITKNNLYELLYPWLGQGLLVSSDKKWFSRRKIITPAFHFKILEQFTDVFDNQSKIFIEQLKKQVNKGSFNIYPFITLYALDVISETAMGTPINAQLNKETEYVKAVADITKILTTRFVKVWQRKEFMFKFYKNTKQRQDKAIEIMHKFTRSVIETRRKQIFNEKNELNEEILNENEEMGIKKKMCLLDILLKSNVDGERLSDEDIREEVDTFMFEGHDTTSSTISYFIYCLSKEKEVQDKLFLEIKNEFGSNPNTPQDYRSVNNLKYMDLVLKEVLRLYPPVPIIGRLITEDFKIPDGRILPAGSNVSIGLINLMSDPEIFENPTKFDPDRFLKEKTVETINPYAFIPFSAGPRNCIGQKFAQLEIKSVIAKILRNFEILPGDEDPILYMSIVLRSKNGVQINLKPRTY